jgi:hypothetical protein
MIGTLPAWSLAPREYGYALDAVMPRLAGEESLVVRCHVAALEAEIRQRLARWTAQGQARVALWVEPLVDDWQAELEALAAALAGDGTLIVIASRPLARLLPEAGQITGTTRRGWPGRPLGLQPGGIRRLRRTLERQGFRLEGEYGVHTLAAIGLNLLGQQLARWGRPDLGDRLGFAGRLRYCTAGRLAPLSTVALLVARAARLRSPDRFAETCQAWSSSVVDLPSTTSSGEVDRAVARLDAWLETMRGPGGYGGPVAHWWQQSLLYAGPGLDWRYEGIIGGYLLLWERSGDGLWLQKARRAGDDLLAGQLEDGHYPASAFELNPATGGTPHEAACDVGLLRLALALREAGDATWERYAAAAMRNLQTFYVEALWDAEARSFRDSSGAPSFVPNKAATAGEALFLLTELSGEASWVERYALSTLDRIVAYQVQDGGPLDGAIAQNSIGRQRIEKYFPLYIARCVPALLRGYEWAGEERYADCARRAVQFVARWAGPDGSLPAVVYPGGRVNRYPGWVAPLGDVLRAADLARPYGFDGDLGPTRHRLLAGQDISGGIQTATGFAAQAGGRLPALPDLRDLLHVTGWCAMAFRYLAAHAGPALPGEEQSLPFEAECTFRGQSLHLSETATEVAARSGGRVRYRWRKGDPWPQVAEPEFWLR